MGEETTVDRLEIEDFSKDTLVLMEGDTDGVLAELQRPHLRALVNTVDPEDGFVALVPDDVDRLIEFLTTWREGVA